MNKVSLLLALVLAFSGQAALAADSMMKGDMKMQGQNEGMMKQDGAMMKPAHAGKKKVRHMHHSHKMGSKAMDKKPMGKQPMNKM